MGKLLDLPEGVTKERWKAQICTIAVPGGSED